MATGGEVAVGYISIIPETSKVAPGVKKAFAGVDSTMASTGSSWGKKLMGAAGKTMKVAASTVGVSVGGVFAGAMAKGFGRLSAIDQAKAKLTGLGNDAATVTGIMDDALASVKGTAHGLEEAATTSAALVASGIKPGRELEQVLTTVGDTASIAGIKMEEMGAIFGSVAARGKLQGDDMLQLTSRGVPVLQMLGKTLGKTSAEISDMVTKGQIDFATFEKAMREGMGGAALEMGKTFSGSFANMKAALGRFGEALLAPAFAGAPPIFNALGASFDTVTAAMQPALDRVGGALTPAMESLAGVIETRLAPRLGDVAGKVADVAAAFVEHAVDPATWDRVGEVFSFLARAAKIAWGPVSSLLEAFGRISQAISVHVWEALIKVLEALAPVLESVVVPALEQVAVFAEEHPQLVGAMVTAWLGMKGLNAVTNPLKGLAGALLKVGKVFVLMKFAQEMATLATAVSATNPALAAGARMASRLATAFNPLGTVLKFILNPVKTLGKLFIGLITKINPVVAIISLVVGALVLFFTKTETGRRIWAPFMDVLRQGWQWLKSALAPAFQRLGEIVSQVWEGIKAGWDILWQGMQTAWETVLRPVLEGIWQVAKITIGVIATAILAPLLIAWNAMSAAFQWAWETVLRPIWEGLATVAQWVWTNILKPAIDGIVFSWQNMGLLFSTVWQTWIKPVWDGLVMVAQWAWTTIIQPVLTALQAAWSFVGQIFQWVWTSLIKPAWDGLALGIQWGWTTVIMPVWEAMKAGLQVLGDFFRMAWESWIKPTWDALGTGIRWVVDTVVKPAWDAMKSGLDALKARFDQVVDAIRATWEKLRGYLAKPINFMIDFVINRGIVAAWNKVGSFIDLPTLHEVSRIPEHATGGAIRGPGNGTSDDVLMWGSDGEHMITAAEVRAAGGHSAVYLLRDLIANGIPFTWDHGRILKDMGRDNILAARSNLRAGLPLEGLPALDGYKRGGEVNRPAWMDQLAAGHRFAQSISPGPYILGGSSSQGSTDCSGFMSEIADVILGGPGGTRKWSTESFPGPQAGAWAPGLGQGFSVGIMHGGPAAGHTAGTLSAVDNFSAVNVESGGGTGQGATYGGAAVGADHPQFTEQHHLKIGADGAFESAGGPSPAQMLAKIKQKITEILDKILDPISGSIGKVVGTPPPDVLAVPGNVLDIMKPKAKDELFDIAEGLGDLLRSAYNKAKDFVTDVVSFVVRDTGGWLPMGTTIVRNETGRPEAVLNWEQIEKIRSALDAVGRNADVIASGRRATDLTDEEVHTLRGLAQGAGFSVGEFDPEWRTADYETRWDLIGRQIASEAGVSIGKELLGLIGLKGELPEVRVAGRRVGPGAQAGIPGRGLADAGYPGLGGHRRGRRGRADRDRTDGARQGRARGHAGAARRDRVGRRRPGQAGGPGGLRQARLHRADVDGRRLDHRQGVLVEPHRPQPIEWCVRAVPVPGGHQGHLPARREPRPRGAGRGRGPLHHRPLHRSDACAPVLGGQRLVRPGRTRPGHRHDGQGHHPA